MMTVSLSDKTKYFGKLLFYFNVVVLILSPVVLPVYQQMQGNAAWSWVNVSQIALVCIDCVLSKLIEKGNKLALYGIGVSSIMMATIPVISNADLDVGAYLLRCLVFGLDFIIAFALSIKFNR